VSRLPPESLSVGTVTIRRWRGDDVAALDAMIASSLEHLRPWMPWVEDEPRSFEERATKVAEWVRRWEAAEGFMFAITDGDDLLLGTCGLHRQQSADSWEIGYWVRAGRTGEGIATSATQALVEAAFSLDSISSLEIHHDGANIASAAVSMKAGFARAAERHDDPVAPGEIGIDVTWRLDRPAP